MLFIRAVNRLRVPIWCKTLALGADDIFRYIGESGLRVKHCFEILVSR